MRQPLVPHGADAVVRRLNAAPPPVAVDLPRGGLEVLHEDGEDAPRTDDGCAVAQHILDVVAHALVRRSLLPRLLLEVVRKPTLPCAPSAQCALLPAVRTRGSDRWTTVAECMGAHLQR